MRRLFEHPRDWPGQLRVQRDLAMLWLGFHCALRRSELCALTLGDIAHLESGKGLRINIAMSKTDQAGKGARLPLHRPTGAVPRHLDAVGLVWEWVTFMRSLPGVTSTTPLFPALDRWGHVLERTVDGTRVQHSQLDPQSWSNRLQELARAARVFGDDLSDIRYSQVKGHSLRRGYVTTALLAGLDATVVALQTRHRDIRMIRRYADEIQLLEGMNLADALSSQTVADEGGGGSAEGRTVEMAVLANARPSP